MTYKPNPLRADPKPEPTPKKVKKPISKVSVKRSEEEKIYKVNRVLFLKENPICFIAGCGKKATTIEHSTGRIGKNFLDESTWRPCCAPHNLELENNPELSREYQVSKITGNKKMEK